MTIIESSKDLTAKDIYNLAMNPHTQKMKDVKGQRIDIAAWAVYEDMNKKSGEPIKILAISTPEGETFATNSPTFINDFLSMLDLFNSMGEIVPAITVTSGTSKAGREFITCAYSD